MLLRDHPLMSYKGNRSWPPRWLRRGGQETTNPQGEVGILKDVILSSIEPYDRCYLVIEHSDAEYLGLLVLSDRAFSERFSVYYVKTVVKRSRRLGALICEALPWSACAAKVRLGDFA
jgi:hypothetical protein